jgi:hypothetical protein
MTDTEYMDRAEAALAAIERAAIASTTRPTPTSTTSGWAG